MTIEKDVYHVFPFKGRASVFNTGDTRARASYSAIKENANNAFLVGVNGNTRKNVSAEFAQEWLDAFVRETKELPAILPSFVKTHLPAGAIEKAKEILPTLKGEKLEDLLQTKFD